MTVTTAPVNDSDDAILAAVLMHEIAAAGVKPDEGICLRVRDTAGKTADASPELVAMVQAKHAKAVAASACSGGDTGPIVVTSPAGPGVMFDVGPVVREGSRVKVEGGGGHRGGGAIREIEYILERGAAGWAVKSERVLRET